jgi:hypothetical protein
VPRAGSRNTSEDATTGCILCTDCFSPAPGRTLPIAMNEEASYICDACGEEIVVPIDLSAGESQEYVEDCPVCCRPNVVHVEIEEQGEVRVWAEAE